MARAVADSPLVKTALHGADPNFGRILQAAGQALAGRRRRSSSTSTIEGRQVVSAGDAVGARAGRAARARGARSPADEVEFELTMPGEGGETEVFFSDLTHDYVTLQRGLHDHEGDVATLLEALPYIRDFHGRPW